MELASLVATGMDFALDFAALYQIKIKLDGLFQADRPVAVSGNH